MTKHNTSPQNNQHDKHQLERPEPRFYTRIPHLVVDSLNAYELAVYVAIKRTAQDDGKCFKSKTTLARELGISTKKLLTVRARLEELGFIRVTHKPDENGNVNTPAVIEIVDVWGKNDEKYSAGGMHLMHGGYVPDTPPRVPDTPKEESFKKNHLRNPIALADASARASVLIDKDDTADDLLKVVAKALFDVTDIQTKNAGRIGKACKVFREHGVTHNQVSKFCDWYYDKHKTASLPRDAAKLETHVLAWLSEQSKHNQARYEIVEFHDPFDDLINR